ncbi:MAG: AraC family transcriptional regulator [Tepidisphaeraceae bacterium]
MSELHDPIRDFHHLGSDTFERIVQPSGSSGLLARGIYLAGLSDAGLKYRMAASEAQTAHLLVCFRGAGRVWTGGRWEDCGPGAAYVSPRRASRVYETVGRRRWQFAWAHFLADATFPAQGQSRVIKVDPRPFVGAIEGLYHETTHASRDLSLIDTWATLVWANAQRIIDPLGRPDPLWALWSAVDARLMEHWSLDRLASEATMTPESLRRLCQRVLGCSPMKHVVELRMRRAEALLSSTPAKLQAIAHAIGYQNVFAFSAAFKRWKGVPPVACRHHTQDDRPKL